MEIHLVERKKGKISNVEVYDQDDFMDLITANLTVAIKESSWLERLFVDTKDLVWRTNVLIMRQFEDRLKQNLNRRK